jgi:hypothetical protein
LTVSKDKAPISVAADWLRSASFRGDDGKTPAVLSGASCFHRRVEGEKIGLAGDLLHDSDFLGDRLHGVDRSPDSGTACLGVLGRLPGDRLGLAGVLGVLLDVCRRYLLHR